MRSKSLLKRADLPEIRFHDLSYTAATLLLSRGVPPEPVQELLGHADHNVILYPWWVLGDGPEHQLAALRFLIVPAAPSLVVCLAKAFKFRVLP